MNNTPWRIVAFRAVSEWLERSKPHGDESAAARLLDAVQRGKDDEALDAIEAFEIELADCGACYCFNCGAIIDDGDGTTDENGDPTCDTCAELTRGAK